MYVPNLNFIEIKDDREKLIEFIWWLQQFLNSLVQETQSTTTDTPLFSPELPKEIRDAITVAWKEINDAGRCFTKLSTFKKIFR